MHNIELFVLSEMIVGEIVVKSPCDRYGVREHNARCLAVRCSARLGAGRWWATGPAHLRKELVRFDSFRFRVFRILIGSVRFGKTTQCSGSTRFGLRFSDASRLGPVRFGSFPCSVPAGSEIKRFGSVWFGRFGSVSYSFLITGVRLLQGSSCLRTTSGKYVFDCFVE